MEVRRWWATAYGQWVRVVAFDLFFVVFKSLCRELYCSRYTCAEGDPLGSRHRALCRPSGAGSALPRAPSRHRLCREHTALCRVGPALGRGPDSGSAISRMDLLCALADVLRCVRSDLAVATGACDPGLLCSAPQRAASYDAMESMKQTFFKGRHEKTCILSHVWVGLVPPLHAT
jgi:hypothetical protein